MAKKATSSTSRQKTKTEPKTVVKTPAKASKLKSPKSKETEKKSSLDKSIDPDRFDRMVADLEKAERDRDQMGGELQATAEKLRATFESMNDGIAITDETGNLTEVNGSFLQMFDYDQRNEVIGKNALDFIAESDRGRVMMDLARTIAEQSKDTREYKMVTRNGVELDAEISTSALLDSCGNAVGSIAVIRNVSERRQMQEEIRASEQKLRTLFETITDGIVMIDLDGKIIDTNLAGCTIAGYESKEEVIGRNGLEFSDNPEEMANDLMKAVTGETREGSTVVLRKKDGTPFYCEINAAMINDASGNPIGLVAVERDVTERMQMQEELRKTAEKMRILFDTVGDMFIVTNMKMDIASANGAAARLLGYQREEDLIGKSVMEYVVEKDRVRVLDIMYNTLNTKEGSGTVNFECKFTGAGGREFDGEVTADLLRDCTSMPVGLVITSRDVTERRQMLERVRTSEEKLKTVFETINDGIVIVDLEGKIVDVNTAACQFAGYKKEELIGVDSIQFASEDDRDRMATDIMEAMAKGNASTSSLIYKLNKKDGGTFDCEMSTSVLRDGLGNPTGFVAVERDVTERLKLERQLKEQTAMLIQSEKKSSLGTLVNGVAHELNNPMTGIIQYAQHCLRHTDKEDRKYEVLQDIEKEARRCANIVWNLVTFARMEAEGEEAYISSSIAELVDRVLMLLNYQFKSNSVSVTRQYADDLPLIKVQQTAIEQVLVNIVNNAMESMKNSTRKEIRFEGSVLKGYLSLSITDTGKGITYDVLQRVFDPFYTTKTVGEGTGLGLSVSKSICQQHGGDIICESQPGIGTTFTLKLPVAIT